MKHDSTKTQLKVCYILSYYFPQYVRTQSLIAGLERLEHVEVFTAINKNTGLFHYFETLFKLIWIQLRHRPDVYILGFRGYELFGIIRLLTLGKPLIFDHMMSPYDSLVYEKEKVRPNSLLAKFIYRYEKWVLKTSQLVLTDTTLHKNHFTTHFQLANNHVHIIPISTNESLFHPQPANTAAKPDCFRIFFYGSFLPLHGIDVILKTAVSLKHLPIQFTLVGGHKLDLTHFHEQIKQQNLDNIEHLPWVDYQTLPQHIANANLCLGGPFGNTPQAQRIVTGKTVQFLAMEKPTIVGKIEGYDMFVDRKNCLLVPQADAITLTDAIQWAYHHQEALPDIAQQGNELYHNHFSIEQISRYLEDSLDQVIRYE